MWNTGKILWAQQDILKALGGWNYWDRMLSVTPHFCNHSAYQKIPSAASWWGSAFPVSLALGLRDTMVISLKCKSLEFLFHKNPVTIRFASHLIPNSMLTVISHSFRLRPHPRVKSSGTHRWLWFGTTGSCTPLTSLLRCPSSRTVLEGAPQEQVLLSVSEVAMSEIEKEKLANL